MKGLLSRILFCDWWLVPLFLCTCVCVTHWDRLRGWVLQVRPRCNQSPPRPPGLQLVDYHINWYLLWLFCIFIAFLADKERTPSASLLHFRKRKIIISPISEVEDHDSSTTWPLHQSHTLHLAPPSTSNTHIRPATSGYSAVHEFRFKQYSAWFTATDQPQFYCNPVITSSTATQQSWNWKYYERSPMEPKPRPHETTRGQRCSSSSSWIRPK